MRRKTVRASKRRPRLEILEDRTVPSVALSGTTLVIRGTSGGDYTLIRSERSNDQDLIVVDHQDAGTFSQTFRFPASQVTKIDYQGLAGNDQYYNNTNKDEMADGGDGDDTMFGGENITNLMGGAGDDVLAARGTLSNRIQGGGGHDRIGFYGPEGAPVGLHNELYGGEGNDEIHGSGNATYIDGGEGNDDVYAQGGNDTLIGGFGNDILRGGAGDDVMDGNEGNDQLGGVEGNDTLRGGIGDDTLYGGSGHDVLQGDGGSNVLDGGDGNDTLHGSPPGDESPDDLNGGGGGDLYVTAPASLGGRDVVYNFNEAEGDRYAHLSPPAIPTPPAPTSVALLSVKQGRQRRLIARVQYSHGGPARNVRSPFQSPPYRGVRAALSDQNGDGTFDAVVFTAQRPGRKLVSRVVSL